MGKYAKEIKGIIYILYIYIYIFIYIIDTIFKNPKYIPFSLLSYGDIHVLD